MDVSPNGDIPSNQPAPISPAGMRPKKRNSFNEFCHQYMKQAECIGLPLSEKNKKAKIAYDKLDRDEKASLQEKAKASWPGNASPGSCGDRARKLVRKLEKTIYELDSLGVKAACLVEDGKQAFGIETTACIGLTTAWTPSFHARRGNNDRSASQSVDSSSTVEDVRTLFKRKWVHAGGKGSGPSYKNRNGFTVHGLPVPFHRPQDYGSGQRKLIIEHRDEISFEMHV